MSLKLDIQNRSFAVISASFPKFSVKNRNSLINTIFADFRFNGCQNDVHIVRGHYDDSGKVEMGALVFEMPLEEAVAIGHEFGQESILFSTGSTEKEGIIQAPTFYLIKCIPSTVCVFPTPLNSRPALMGNPGIELIHTPYTSEGHLGHAEISRESVMARGNEVVFHEKAPELYYSVITDETGADLIFECKFSF